MATATTPCKGFNRDEIWVACESPRLPVDQGGRCIRCARLHRGRQLAAADPFVSINDTPLPGDSNYPQRPRPVVPAPVAVETPAPQPEQRYRHHQWGKKYPSCCLCGRTDRRPDGHGLCVTCMVRSGHWRRRGAGLTLTWVPIQGDRYDHAGAKRWVTVRDIDEAWRYLEQRAAAGQLPPGGKVAIRAAARADNLPAEVIRRAA